MKYKITTEYSFDDVADWTGEPIEDFKEEEKRGWLSDTEIESIIFEDEFPLSTKIISGRIIAYTDSYVEYEISRIIEIETPEELEKVEEWNKNCSNSTIIEL